MLHSETGNVQRQRYYQLDTFQSSYSSTQTALKEGKLIISRESAQQYALERASHLQVPKHQLPCVDIIIGVAGFDPEEAEGSGASEPTGDTRAGAGTTSASLFTLTIDAVEAASEVAILLKEKMTLLKSRPKIKINKENLVLRFPCSRSHSAVDGTTIVEHHPPHLKTPSISGELRGVGCTARLATIIPFQYLREFETAEDVIDPVFYRPLNFTEGMLAQLESKGVTWLVSRDCSTQAAATATAAEAVSDRAEADEQDELVYGQVKEVNKRGMQVLQSMQGVQVTVELSCHRHHDPNGQSEKIFFPLSPVSRHNFI